MIEIISHSNLNGKYFESVTQGVTIKAGRMIRPAETHSHLVISKGPQHSQAYFVGPFESSTQLQYESDAEIIWIKLNLGVHIRRTPSFAFQNTEEVLNPFSGEQLSLYGQAFTIPTGIGVDGFLAHLERSGVLDYDPLVIESLQNSEITIPERTLRYRFLSSVGLSKASILQIQRVKHASSLISKGQEFTNVALSLGYYDLSHMSRNFRKYLGVTPGASRHGLRES